MRTKLGSYVNDLKDNEEICVRIAEKDRDPFFEECQDFGIHQLMNGKEFRREDVRGLMEICSDHKVGYVSALCFKAVTGDRPSVRTDGKDIHVIALDYDRLLKGEDGKIVS